MNPAADTSHRYEDDEISLKEVWNLLMRNKLVIILSTLLVSGAAVAYSLWSVPIFEATTSVRIDEEKSNLPVLDILTELSGGSEVETEMEVMRSRVLAEEVVDSLDLQFAVLAPRRVARTVLFSQIEISRLVSEQELLIERVGQGFQVTDMESGEVVGSVAPLQSVDLGGVSFTPTLAAAQAGPIRVAILVFEEAVEDLQEQLAIARPNREAGIVTARYESADTQLVHAVPNQLAASFIARRNRIQRTSATSTVDFIAEQIDTLGTQLNEAEEDLIAFREAEDVFAPEAEATAQVTQLIQLQAERNTLDAERAALQQLVDEIRAEEAASVAGDASAYRRLLSFPSLLRNQATSEQLRLLTEVENRRSLLSERRTDEDTEMQNLAERVAEIERELGGMAMTYLQGLTNQVASMDEILGDFVGDLAVIPEKEVQLARRVREAEVLSELYTLLQTRLKEAQIAEAVEDLSIRVVDPAVLPLEPVKPRKRLNVALGLVLGLMMGVGLAFTREYMDETVHTREDLVEASGGVSVMGMIPSIHEQAVGYQTRVPHTSTDVRHLAEHLVAGRDPRSPVSEAYRSLRTNITFSNPDRPPKTLVFTSAVPQDGKSTTSANFAITLSQQGIKSLLIDADLRRGVLNGVFGVPREPGLSNVIAGTTPFEDAVTDIELGESGRLCFLPTGTLPPNPAEILGSDRMKALLDRLEAEFDVIIFDSAPLTLVTDAAVLGTQADGVLVVARANNTERGALRFAVEQLGNVRAPVLGTILNDVNFKRDMRYSSKYGGYGSYSTYYYGADK